MPTMVNRRRRLLLTAILVTLAALLGAVNGLGRIDQMIYDRAISLMSRTAPDDILIIVIDDQTVATLGRWPWPRAIHAALLDRLHGARAVGLGIVFAEADKRYHDSDRVLADAMRRHGRVVLPVVLDYLDQPTHVNLPLEPLAQAAAALGYINIGLDDDSVVRRATWTRRVDGMTWNHFSLAMLQAGGQAETAREFLARLAPLDTSVIPYAGPPGHFRTVSYLSVLRNDMPPDTFRDKYVLVGVWATGMGNIFPAPVSHRASGIAGVEIMANLLYSARQGLVVQSAQAWQTALASAIPMLLLCLVLPQLSPRYAMLCSAALLAAVLAFALAALWWGDTWIPPTAALLGVAICYPLWSWRSQEAALRYMDSEMKRLRVEYPPVLDETGPRTGRARRSLDQYVDELDRTLRRVRNLRRFLIDGLDGLSDAALVIDQAGRLQFHNRPAIMYFLNLSIPPPPIGKALAPALEQAFDEPATQQLVREVLCVRDDETGLRDTPPPHINVEIRDRAGQDLLLRCTPIHTAQGSHAGLVVTLSDITIMRQAERQREETLRFISHDMRAPQNSILALIALSQANHTDTRPVEVLTRIAHLANRTLRLVDDFIQLTRAESIDIAHVKLDLADLVREAADEFWAPAQVRGITLDVQTPESAALTYGDQMLIMRAVYNLLDNAIKYCSDGGRIQLRVRDDSDTWDIEIEDTGPGIAPQDQARLFEPFFRLDEAHQSSIRGAGLGLPFVRTVALRHGGRICVHSERGAGARFTLSLPKALDNGAYET